MIYDDNETCLVLKQQMLSACVNHLLIYRCLPAILTMLGLGLGSWPLYYTVLMNFRNSGPSE